MLMELIYGIGMLYYWTWIIWPFVLMFSFVNAITSKIKGEKESGKYTVIAAISLLIILAGIITLSNNN